MTEVIAVRGRRVMLNLGNGKYHGFDGVPPACRDRPEEIELLLRHADRPGNEVPAYGAGRAVQ